MTYERVTVQNDQTNNSVYKSDHFIQTNEDNSVIVCLFVRQTLNPFRTTERLCQELVMFAHNDVFYT